MKTRLVYLLLFLCCFGIGCQEKYSEPILVEYFELNKSLKRNNNFIEHTTRDLIMRLEENAMIRTQLQFLEKKAKKIHDASMYINLYGPFLKFFSFSHKLFRHLTKMLNSNICAITSQLRLRTTVKRKTCFLCFTG